MSSATNRSRSAARTIKPATVIASLLLGALIVSSLIGAVQSCGGAIPQFVEPQATTPEFLGTWPCRHRGEVKKILPVIYSAIADEAEKAGHNRARVLNAMNSYAGQVCVLDVPLPCCVAGLCAGPCSGQYCARKAGCMAYAYVWVSKTWSFKCTEYWPNEPNCGNTITTLSWWRTLAHEMVNVFAVGYLGIHDQQYKTWVYSGPDQRVQGAVDEWVKKTLPNLAR